MGNPRCGACGEKFDTAKEVVEHVKTCKTAQIYLGILKPILDEAKGKD